MTANEKYEKLKDTKNKYNMCVEEIENQYKSLKTFIENIDFCNKDRAFINFFDDELTCLLSVMNSAKMYEEEFEEKMLNEKYKLENEICIKEINNDRENKNR